VDVQMDRAALQAFLSEVFPQVADDFTVEDIRPMEARIRLHVGDKNLRPGGTVSGPAMFALADVRSTSPFSP
jgi:acyl-coenzyme A thioesterase PaaI-like protein